MPRVSRLDAHPLFVRKLRSRTSSGIYAPALSAGSTTGVVHYVRLQGIEIRARASRRAAGPQNPSPGDWPGIQFSNTAGGSDG